MSGGRTPGAALEPCVVWGTDDDEATLWLQPSPDLLGPRLCIGVGETKAEALVEAREALVTAAAQLDRLERAL